MKKCLRCGNENPDEMQFCLNCGNPLSALANQNVQYFSPAREIPAKSNRKWIFAGAAVLVVAVLLLGGAVAALVFLIRNSKQTNVTTANRATTANQATLSSVNQNRRTNTNSANLNSNQQSASNITDEPTKEGSFTVSASKGWQLSDVKVVPLEQFLTTVEGKIDLAGVKTNVSANGVRNASAKSRRLYPQFPTGALLMRTRLDAGGYSNIVSVTAQNPLGMWRNAKDERGKIEFVVNDNAPASNTGEFTVKVILVSVP